MIDCGKDWWLVAPTAIVLTHGAEQVAGLVADGTQAPPERHRAEPAGPMGLRRAMAPSAGSATAGLYANYRTQPAEFVDFAHGRLCARMREIA